jgi:3-oxoacyl-[acyl-carrier-protein] synthase-3
MAVPARVVTNAQLELAVPGVNALWTEQTLGIRERRIAGPEEHSGTLAAQAGRMALWNAGVPPADIGLVVVCTTTPFRQAPSVACWVQHEIGADGCAAFDLGAVCAGFIYGLGVANAFMASGAIAHALVVGVDVFSRITDWGRRDCVFFGDGAGAVVLGKCADNEGIIALDLGADGSRGEDWHVPSGERYWSMNGPAVAHAATERMQETLRNVLQVARASIGDVDHVLPHQPSLQVLRSASTDMGIPFERVHTNMGRFANCAAGTVPIVFHEAHRDGAFSPGQLLALVGVGAGWAWGSALIRWTR